MLKLYVLGPPRVELNDVAVHIRRRKALALLVYLAVTGRIHSRDALATLFYPNRGQSRARTYFRRDLGALNTQLKGDWLEADNETVGFSQNAEVWTDMAQFRHNLAACNDLDKAYEDSLPDCFPPLITASELYADHFLAGFSLPDCPEFDEWQFFESENLRQELAAALRRLAAILIAQEQYERALPFARRLLKLDPLHEPAQRQLMVLYAHAGQQAAALRQYQKCVALLDKELGLAPAEETTKLYEDIKARRLEQPKVPIETPKLVAITHLPSAITHPQPTVQQLPTFLVDDTAADLAPPTFVAREQEMSQLAAALDSARAGQGKVLFVIGGAGRGKSMLVQEFARQAQDNDPNLVVVSGNCDAIAGIGDPYLPFREALTMLTGGVEARWSGGLISQINARQLWKLMPISLPALVKQAPDLIDSLIPGQPLLERASTFAQKNSPWFKRLAALTADEHVTALDQLQLFAQYASVLKAVAAQRPFLLIIEDLHWVDTASSGLLFHLSREIGDSHILLVGTYRPEEITLSRLSSPQAGYEEQHPLAGIVSELKRRHGDIWLDLGNLDTTAGRHFVDAYLDTEPNRLGEAFRDALFRRTEGHALFTVELLRAMQEREELRQDEQGRWFESEATDWTMLPVKVDGVIERRLERLPEELQTILSIASIEGETFTAEVIAGVQQLDQRALVQQLSRELDKRHRLVTVQGIKWLEPGRQRLSSYRFRHQLFQQYMYNRLDDVQRAYLHEAVGNVLEQLYAGRTEEVAGRLARHFQMAGLFSKAFAYLQQAGDTAVALHANAEAVAHYTLALEMAKQHEVGIEDLAHLYTCLGGQLLVTKGDGAAEVGQAYGRAVKLYQQVGESPQLFTALRGLAMFYKQRGELETAQNLTEKLVKLAQSLQDPELIIEASFAMGSLLYYLGEHVLAQEYLDQGINNYELIKHHALTLLYDQDLGVALLSYASSNLRLLGYPDRALERCAETLALARELSHPYSLAMALSYTDWVHLFLNNNETVLEQSQALISLSAEHDFQLYLALGTLQKGRAMTEQGDVDAGITQMQQGLTTAALAIGSDNASPAMLLHLAKAYCKSRLPDEGLLVVAKVLTQLKKSEERLQESEIYRLKGEFLLIRGEPDNEVEANFQQAIDISHRQQAKSLELRAVMSLSRLWQSQGKPEAARQILVEIYDWFTEGFDTHDLKEANALLKELS